MLQICWSCTTAKTCSQYAKHTAHSVLLYNNSIIHSILVLTVHQLRVQFTVTTYMYSCIHVSHFFLNSSNMEDNIYYYY